MNIKKIYCIIIFLCCILYTHATEYIATDRTISDALYSISQSNNTQWWTAKALSFRIGNKVEDFEPCNIRILQEERVVKIFTKETLVLISVEKEKLSRDDEGNIYQSRLCVDGDGERCLVEFMYEPADHIYLFVEYKDVTACYLIIPD